MVVENKSILPVLFFLLLCFMSIHARVIICAARTLKEKRYTGGSSTTHYKETHDHVFKPKEDKGNANEVFSMDYTPARRKPPIHNLK
ncbi:hypothetical protein Fmac_004248 [Flemingia macrophylla]|uniref:Uncharacterized protein n=1 Tax=Flemingia macrophylla TaxID=520843 RepID=A0ABD1N5S9_9FABA